MAALHYQISPLLMSVLLECPLADLPARLTPSMLPGRYTKEFLKRRKFMAPILPRNVHPMRCMTCGYRGQYDLKTIAMNPSAVEHAKSPLASFQATGYFRCKQCNGAGAWEVDPLLPLLFMAQMLETPMTGEPDPHPAVVFSTVDLFDGTEPRWATDAEEHLLGLIQEGPGNRGFLWNRLGNVYLRGGRADLAACAFERSISLDAAQFESLASLGYVLEECGEWLHGTKFYLRAIAAARVYRLLDTAALRELLAEVLHKLANLHMRYPDEVPLIPSQADYETVGLPWTADDGIRLISEYRVDLTDPTSFLPLADTLLGDRHGVVELGRKKVGRNDLCPCGSGRKYKRCCGA